MALFDRSLLIKSLETFPETMKGIPNGEVNSYLHHYQLCDLASSSIYRIGRLTLDEVPVTIQLFQHPAEDASQGTVIVTHGYMDHVGLYVHLINALYQQGFNVLCYDMSGHGLSDGDPLNVDDFEHYALQLDALIKFVRSIEKGPVHLIGQSTGGAVICAQHLLLEDPQPLSGGKRVLLAPLVRPAMWKSIQRRFRWLKYMIKRVPRRYSRSSHDQEFVRFISEDDPLQHDQIPVSWIGAMLAWGDWLEKQSATDERMYIVQGTDDKTVDWKYNLAVLEQVYPNNEVLLINEARHHLVNETEVYQAELFAFIERALKANDG